MGATGFFHIWPPRPRLGVPAPAYADADFTYEHVGATASTPPKGWNVDRYDGVVGHGAQDWARARNAIDRLVMFDLGWTRLVQGDKVAVGSEVVFAAQLPGVWTLNACRIVYTVDEETPDEAHYGFAYGTLPQHAVRGEERFCAHWDKKTDRIRFEVYKFSLPQHPLVRLFQPVALHYQHRFNRDCIARMRREVTGG